MYSVLDLVVFMCGIKSRLIVSQMVQMADHTGNAQRWPILVDETFDDLSSKLKCP